MKKHFIINILGTFTAAVFLCGCAPQARFFNVDVKSNKGKNLNINDRKAAVFPIVTSNAPDSIRISNVALGVAEKMERDRQMSQGEIPVFSIPKSEFGYDKTYLQELMLKSGGDIQIFVNDLKFYRYNVTRQATGYFNEYAGMNVILPYSVEMNVYNALQDTIMLSVKQKDTIYLQISNGINEAKIGDAISSYMPEISKKIGASLASGLTTQWITQERMLITYEGENSWEKPYELAQDFKWQEAIDLWLPLTYSQNRRRAAFAAYNIAVACEMTEQFPLAMEWVKLSLEKFPFKEAEELRVHLLNIKKEN